ncbi:SIS domain-containing protein [Sporolactobacillus shoreae]|uniref:SIS domain-containing protein n=1 Tax=Sporolactobacillus shoreae TaxID=1465501 RepID=A0A4Z0GPJ5_9BACL|nr:SIS domain-containing protein [Sporolactobacillus shoreae]TGA98326.1 SIS domain-containing protein [Sporolactobacillus shoreae]
MFNLSETEINTKKARYTIHEIQQQPELWEELFMSIKTNRKNIDHFLQNLIDRFQSIRVIFTGAGTSEFAGNVITPLLRKNSHIPHLSYESIPTTDIVSDPLSFLLKDVPTVIVSFARSGDSPESVAAVNLARKIIRNCFFITITCNAKGSLARLMEKDDKCLTIIMPEKSNDKGFAMTSSFTCMLYAAYLVFIPEMTETTNRNLINTAIKFIKTCEKSVIRLEKFKFKRVIYLGSGALGKLTQEAALKCLELNAGKIDTYHDSSMGFRHGPKSLQSDETLIILFGSSDSYTKMYDYDIALEVASEPLTSKLAVLCSNIEVENYSCADLTIPFYIVDSMHDNDLLRSFFCILFSQIFALHHSLILGITPDNPSPDGKVNRVVQGVKIHDFN